MSHVCEKNNMSGTAAPPALSRRERQIMDVLYRLGRATAGEIMAGMPGAPSYSTVRTQLRVLEEKGHVRHHEEGLRYLYAPTVPRSTARKAAVQHLVRTFFDGSPASLLAALLGETATLSEAELARIAQLVDTARNGRP